LFCLTKRINLYAYKIIVPQKFNFMEKLIIPSILSVSDVISMSERILKITQPLTQIDPKFMNLHTNTSLIFARLVKNQKYTSKSSLTEELIRLDKNRDLGYICLRDILHGMSVSLIEEISSKAAKLYAIFDKYGTQIYKLGYKAESATMLSLFNELDQKKNQELLSEIDVLPFYNSLKAAEDAFTSASKQKSEEKTVQTNDSEAATEILQEMFPALTNLVAMLQLYSQFEPAIYSETYNLVVTYITETNTAARARNTRKQNVVEEVEKTVS